MTKRRAVLNSMPFSQGTVRVLVSLVAILIAPCLLGAQIQLSLRMDAAPTISITGAPGTVCQVQWTDDMSDPGRWAHFGHYVLSNAPTQILDSGGVSPLRFYRVVQTPNTNLVLIPGGAFEMGDSFSEGDADERPVHRVQVSAFYMDRTEVTNPLWDGVFMWATNHGYAFAGVGASKATNHPLHSVTWFDAIKWCNARSQQEGLTPCYYTDATFAEVYRTAYHASNKVSVKWDANGYRLPTEAEWEKAARGGVRNHRFPWSHTNVITQARANYYSLGQAGFSYEKNLSSGFHSTYATGAKPYTSPVGAFAPNDYGLYDMAGNVAEWCWDWYDSVWYGSPGAVQADSRGPSAGGERVVRGGSWSSNANYERCADRYSSAPNPTSNAATTIGFRCVRQF